MSTSCCLLERPWRYDWSRDFPIDFPETLAGDAVASSEAGLSLLQMPMWCAPGIFTGPKDSILGTVKQRAELVLLTEGKTSPLFRDGRVASRRLWRLGAKVLGKLGDQFEDSSQDPVAAACTAQIVPFC